MASVKFDENRTNALASRMFQWDYGQTLRIYGLSLPPSVEIHFSLNETGEGAVTVLGETVDGVTLAPIPQFILEKETDETYHAFAYIYIVVPNVGTTVKKITLPIVARVKPNPYDPTEEEKHYFENVIVQVNESVAEVNNARDDVEALKGVVESDIAQFKTDAEALKTELETIAHDGIEEHNANATEKTTAFNTNSTNKLRAINEASADGLSAINNASSEALGDIERAKDSSLNEITSATRGAVGNLEASASGLANGLNTVASNLNRDFNTNANQKTEAFNTNASTKTTEINTVINNAKTEINSDVAKVETDKNTVANDKAEVKTLKSGLDEKYGSIVEDVTEIKEDLSNTQNQLNEQIAINLRQDKQIADKERRITNLEFASKGVLYRDEVLEDESYSKDIPSDAMPNGYLDMMGGKSVVWNNLIKNGNFNNLENWEPNNGAVLSVADGVLKIEHERAYAGAYQRVQKIIGHKYYQSGDVKQTDPESFFRVGVNSNNTTGNTDWKKVSAIFTANNADNIFYLIESRGVVKATTTYVKNTRYVDLTPIENSLGITINSVDDPIIKWIESYAELHSEYNEGEIISADVENVVSRGANLWDEEWEVGTIGNNENLVADNDGIRSKNYIEVFPNTTYFCYMGARSDKWGIKINFYNNDTFISGEYFGNTAFTTPSNCNRIKFNTNIEILYKTYLNDIAIIEGTSGTYKPYFKHSESIPSELRAKDGYGMSAGSVYNYWDKKTFKNMKSVDLGECNWFRKSGKSVFYTNSLITEIAKSTLNILCNIYSADTWVNAYSNELSMHMGVGADGLVAFSNPNFTDVASFKASLKGIILHYEATDGGEDYKAVIWHKRVGNLNLGNLNWSASTYDRFISNKVNDIKAVPVTVVGNLLCPIYVASDKNTVEIADKQISVNNDGTIITCDKSYTNGDEYKLAMNGVTLQYELANEEIYDITDIMSDFGTLEVEGGGTITFESESMLPIPNKESLLIKIGGVQ